MKICIVGSSKKFYSGISAYTIAQANAFARANHEVSIVLLRNLVPKFLYPGRERIGNVDSSKDFDCGIDVYEGMDWNSPLTWFKAANFMAKKKPDVIIFHWWTSSVAHMQLFLAIAKMLYGKAPLLLEMHEVVDPLEEKIFPIRIYSRIAGRLITTQFDCFIAHSNDAKKAVLKTYNISTNKISVVPHGPYDDYVKYEKNEVRKELGLDGFVILHFGMIRKYKGIPILVKAFNMLPENIAKKSQLVIVGEDWGDDFELNKDIENSPYKEQIIFKPEFIADSLVAKFFSASDVVVLPYLRTTGSGVANIAIAQFKPVIASDLPTLRELLKDYKGAYYFTKGSSEQLHNKLIKIFNYWENGIELTYVHKGDSWETIVQKYKKIINKLLEKIECE